MSHIKKLILILILIYTQLLCATVIEGVGFAATEKEAKKEALADLAQNIKSEVRSTFESTTTDNTSILIAHSASSKSSINISSNLPILGAEFNSIGKKDEVKVIALLSSKKVNRLYLHKLQNLNSEINLLLKEIEALKSESLKLTLYENIFSLLKEYDRYESVALFLDTELKKRPATTKAKIRIELSKFNSNINSISMACSIISRSFTQKNIFIYPPLLQNTTTVAEFGSIFQKNLKAKLNIVNTPKSASYLLIGEYTLTKSTMVLNYILLNHKTNEVIESKTININSKAYKNIITKPTHIDFDTLLNSGVISSSSLKVSLSSNKGSENLLFYNHEDIELFVKLNKMGYFYIVGYTQLKDTNFSYILELNEGIGNNKFIKFINTDDASHWMSLGKFTVEAPFGIERLQVVASTHKIESLPSTQYNQKSGYYIISKDIKATLTRTRGLKKKKIKTIEFSEDVMSFTTIN